MQRFFSILALALALLLGSGAYAAGAAAPGKTQEGLMNKLLAPGKLMEGHKKLESTDCLSCHAAGNGVPDEKCLECHKDIKQSMARPKSFHKLTKEPCLACHSDHKGRDFDALAFDTEHFDHAKTGFPLAPKHEKVKCIECHVARRTDRAIRQDDHRFFVKTATCVSCHVKDDPHSFSGKMAKKDCNSCHAETSWKKDINFDHKTDAHWALNGKHATTACVDCHTPDAAKSVGGKKAFHWTDLKKACNSCHADYHGFDGLKTPKLGKLSECQTCHKEESWKKDIKFNHNKQTKYILDGMHTEVGCNECHNEAGHFVLLKHHSEAEHAEHEKAEQGRDNQTPVKGASLIGPTKPPLPLRQYHWADLDKKNCATCHASPHLRKFPPKLLAKPCNACHVTDNWLDLGRLERGKFDHNLLTKFPLTGEHAKTSCKSCHVKNDKEVYKFPNGDKQFCVSCHASVHKEQFSPTFTAASCADCHGTTKFSELKPFDHDKTRFKLDGDHLKVKACVSCHVKVPGKMLPTKPPKPAGQFIFAHPENGFCADCHKNVHIGQFHTEFAEKPCRECHTTDTFFKRKPFDHHTTHYDVVGKHAPLACEKCHTPTKDTFPASPHHQKGKFLFPDLATRSCAACHTDPHKGKFGSRCTDCHNEASKWQSIESFHKNDTLTGVHNLLSCDQCHVKERRLTGISENCQFCHRKDDRHNGGLPECGACHNQTTWSANSFHHSMTDFPLLGAHRVAECNACHKNGVYQGSPTDCAGCHIKEARVVAFPNHKLAGFDQCADCHNQFSFRGKK